ncbi:type II toxin-antitoxin system VapC family toxin [Haliscomenobacter hydrossis]|uniref:PilT protein domain protein n=1 Tax=Haliscomenobacter hydrossis (strain ATCC 27775 / DSM 1100 / LMG 10767 / O) TaxID=760192 RepID=F4KPF6_HALH1|nr:type II toxin-antitoxin system VapC family toxin [Haliscomenobacter hydrossis]AEE49910.1 PilT protein domain protein [Haliscomenobacter hydrossis DSM 1100]
MPLLDTNILIYSGEAQFAPQLLSYVTDVRNFASAISIVETLGFHRITPAQIIYFESLFKIVQIAPVDDLVIHTAVELRKTRKMSLGDALIAATAVVLGEVLITRNTTDFTGINGLMVINPLQ